MITCKWCNYKSNIGTHQIPTDKKHREVHQNPGGQHEEHGVKAQDVQKPQVMHAGVTQHL